MKNKKISLPLILGICLLALGLSVVIFFQIRTQLGIRHRQAVLFQMDTLLPERTPGLSSDAAMPVLQINGVDYVALLEIPAFDVRLPVSGSWKGRNLSDSPARFFGSADQGDLVIGGADDARQFGFCDKIEIGTPITVTDMTGAQFQYTVSRVDRSGSSQADWLANADYDLTLFCRDTLSMEYIAVRCSLTFS